MGLVVYVYNSSLRRLGWEDPSSRLAWATKGDPVFKSKTKQLENHSYYINPENVNTLGVLS